MNICLCINHKHSWILIWQYHSTDQELADLQDPWRSRPGMNLNISLVLFLFRSDHIKALVFFSMLKCYMLFALIVQKLWLFIYLFLSRLYLHYLLFRSLGSSGCSQAPRRGTAKLASTLTTAQRLPSFVDQSIDQSIQWSISYLIGQLIDQWYQSVGQFFNHQLISQWSRVAQRSDRWLIFWSGWLFLESID